MRHFALLKLVTSTVLFLSSSFHPLKMRSFHLILCQSFAIIATQAQFLDWDLASSDALGPDQFDQAAGFDIFQPFDISSDFDNAVGSLDYGSNDPMLFADVFNDICSSSSAPLVGKARRRRSNPTCAIGGENPGGENPGGEIPDLSRNSIEQLAIPGEYEQTSCSGGGLRNTIAFFVCPSLSRQDIRRGLFGKSILFHSTRSTLDQYFLSVFVFSRRCRTCGFVNFVSRFYGRQLPWGTFWLTY